MRRQPSSIAERPITVKGISVPLTDEDICAIWSMTPKTLRVYLREGPPRKRFRNHVDFRLIRHHFANGQRRWNRQDVEDIINGEGFELEDKKEAQT